LAQETRLQDQTELSITNELSGAFPATWFLVRLAALELGGFALGVFNVARGVLVKRRREYSTANHFHVTVNATRS
jgi:hypothetical protein